MSIGVQTVKSPPDHLLQMMAAALRHDVIITAGIRCANCMSVHEGEVLAFHPEICSISVYNPCIK